MVNVGRWHFLSTVNPSAYEHSCAYVRVIMWTFKRAQKFILIWIYKKLYTKVFGNRDIAENRKSEQPFPTVNGAIREKHRTCWIVYFWILHRRPCTGSQHHNFVIWKCKSSSNRFSTIRKRLCERKPTNSVY